MPESFAQYSKGIFFQELILALPFFACEHFFGLYSRKIQIALPWVRKYLGINKIQMNKEDKKKGVFFIISLFSKANYT